MTRNVQTVTKRFVVVAALAAGVSGLAYADEGGAVSGPSEAQLQAAASEGPAWHPPQSVYDESPSAWRQSNPEGLSTREMQSMWGTWAGQFRLSQPVFSSGSADESFKQSHPNGLSAREFQAMSSDASAWQMPMRPLTSPLASTNEARVATSAGN